VDLCTWIELISLRHDGTSLYLSVTPAVFHTKVDAQCDTLATVDSRTKLITLATVDVPCRNFSKFIVWDKVLEGSSLISADTRIPVKHSIVLWPGFPAHVQISSLHSFVSVRFGDIAPAACMCVCRWPRLRVCVPVELTYMRALRI